MVFYTKNVMRVLLFLQRVTFICNLLFLLCLILLYTHYSVESRDVQSYIIILGYIVSFLLGFVVHFWELLLLYNRKLSIVPKWLRVF